MREISPCTAEDIASFVKRPVPWRVRGLTVRVNGEIVGIGGYSIRGDGSRVAFVEASEMACKAHRLLLHKAANRVLRDAADNGVVKLVAFCDQSREAAARWLKRLGFEPAGTIKGEQVWKWQR